MHDLQPFGERTLEQETRTIVGRQPCLHNSEPALRHTRMPVPASAGDALYTVINHLDNHLIWARLVESQDILRQLYFLEHRFNHLLGRLKAEAHEPLIALLSELEDVWHQIGRQDLRFSILFAEIQVMRTRSVKP